MTLAYDSVGAMLTDLQNCEVLWYDDTFFGGDFEEPEDAWGFRNEYRSARGDVSEYWVGVACMEITDATVAQAIEKHAQARQLGMTWIEPEPCLIVPVGAYLPKCSVTVILVQPPHTLFPEIEAVLKPVADLLETTTGALAALLSEEHEVYQGAYLIQYANSNELLRLVNS